MTRRSWLLSAGASVLAGAWFGPLPRLAASSFSAHMTLHMAVVALAAPLLAVGIAGHALDPVRRAPKYWPAIPASIVELLTVWVWHAPALHRFARASTFGFALEQGTFLASGLLVWLAAFGGAREDRRQRSGQGSVALLLTSMHMTLLGALLALPPRPLYVHQHAHSHGLTSLQDQHLGGAIMLVAGGLSYLLGGLALAVELVTARKQLRSSP